MLYQSEYQAERIEFQSLIDFAIYLEFYYPEEIYIVAHHEGFYDVDEQGNKFLSKDEINDYLRRIGADICCLAVSTFIYCEKI